MVGQTRQRIYHQETTSSSTLPNSPLLTTLLNPAPPPLVTPPLKTWKAALIVVFYLALVYLTVGSLVLVLLDQFGYISLGRQEGE